MGTSRYAFVDGEHVLVRGNPLLYSDEQCDCDDGCAWDTGGEICEYCAGSGFKLTELGGAMWEMCKAAVDFKRR